MMKQEGDPQRAGPLPCPFETIPLYKTTLKIID